MSSPYKFISFDADDTLWNFRTMMWRGVNRAVGTIHREMGEGFHHITAEFFDEQFHEEMHQQDPQTINYLEVRRTVFERLLKEAGHPASESYSQKIITIYNDARLETWDYFPDVFQTLDKLKENHTLGWITNGTSSPEMAGFNGYFDVVITPDTLDLRKPDPRVFQHALELAGVTAEETMHIGDNLVVDVAGAKAVGCTAVWFNPYQLDNPTDIQADHVVSEMSSILQLI